ncbi:hypothetical protein Goklo_028484 [Gossypium klotzschianum]|uniref:Uncharacterized protein n=1 Tax=Gossypium klotzschianum TaxID=34286 RepID=A0A7J8U1N0_9ROSI|nr:hypothetical protein [Gossypium klotzschianum]
MKLSRCHTVEQGNMSLLIRTHRLRHKERPLNGSNFTLIGRIYQLLL